MLRCELTNTAAVIHIPEAGTNGRRNRRGAVGREKNLGRASEKVSHQHALPVRFETALNFINNRDGCITLILLRNGECRKPSRSRSPTRQRQLHAVRVGGEPN